MGLLDRAPLYYENSVKWQKTLRKACFELVRLSDTFAGYDFLGDIDTHWHTFGYCVGMMNEFYELKPGESIENVRRYNSEAVLLCDLGKTVNYRSGDEVKLPILISNYAQSIKEANLKITLIMGACKIFEAELHPTNIECGKITELYLLDLRLPELENPGEIKISASLTADGLCAENEWQIYAFPTSRYDAQENENYSVFTELTKDELLERLSRGERIVIFGAKPFQYEGTDFQISLAGRTNGHLATVVSDHPITKTIPHEGFLGRQFQEMLTGARAAVLDSKTVPYSPIIEIATSYKNAHKEALLFEYKVGGGKLLVCGLSLNDENPAAAWLRAEIRRYAASEEFEPKISITPDELSFIIDKEVVRSEKNENLALNKNDITAN